MKNRKKKLFFKKLLWFTISNTGISAQITDKTSKVSCLPYAPQLRHSQREKTFLQRGRPTQFVARLAAERRSRRVRRLIGDRTHVAQRARTRSRQLLIGACRRARERCALLSMNTPSIEHKYTHLNACEQYDWLEREEDAVRAGRASWWRRTCSAVVVDVRCGAANLVPVYCPVWLVACAVITLVVLALSLKRIKNKTNFFFKILPTIVADFPL